MSNEKIIAPEWWRSAIIYQIYPRSFRDSSGNGIGDLNGITERLSYVSRLGADAIWLSPIFKSPMKDFGYDVSDYEDIDPIFGSLSDFDRLLSAAHSLGLKVIIDQVWSHSSDQHPWFKESRSSHHNSKADWYVWADANPDGTPPNNWLSVFGGAAWTWDTRREQYYLHNFLAAQPDLNFNNAEVRAAILDVARFWLDRGVDGFRLDVCNLYFHNVDLTDNPVAHPKPNSSNPHDWQLHLHCRNQTQNIEFLAELRMLANEYDERVLIGEIGDADGFPIMVQYTDGSNLLHTAYCFDFLLCNFSVDHVKRVLSKWQRVGRGWPTWALGNHDFPRLATRWGNDAANQAKIKSFAALQLSLRGTICVYQGEELGLTQAELEFHQLQDPEGIAFWPAKQGRDGCRTPMPWRHTSANAGFSTSDLSWLPVPEEHRFKAVSLQTGSPGSILEFYRAFISIRARSRLLREGTFLLMPSSGDVIHFQRSLGREAVDCIFNLGNTATQLKDTQNPKSVLISSGLAVDTEGYVLQPWGFALFEKGEACE